MRNPWPSLEMTLRCGVEVRPWRNARRILEENGEFERFERDVVLPNPQFYEAERVGRWTGNIPPTIKVYRWDGATDTMVLPTGYANRLAKMLAGALTPLGATFPVHDKRVEVPVRKVVSRISLRPYQEKAVASVQDALRHWGCALLVSPPGSGKTEMGLHLMAELGQRTLWITHTNDLLNQVRERTLSRLHIAPEDIGIIGGGKVEIGQVLTIGLVQTLHKLPADMLRDEFGFVVVDEVHHSPALTWSDVLDNLAARYRLGLTGTLERRDGLEHITQMYFGPVTHQVTGLDSGARVVPEVKTVGTDCVPSAWFDFQFQEEMYEYALERWMKGWEPRKPKPPRMPFQAILEGLLLDDRRNELIASLLAEICPGRRTLVLSKLVKHCQMLAFLLRERRPGLRIEVIHGNLPDKLREDIIARAREGEVDVLFSVNVAKEGLDVPCLDQLVFVAGGKDPIYIKQAIGRIQRPYPGKARATVWDVVDWKVGPMKAQYFKRRAIYREMGLITPSAKRKAG